MSIHKILISYALTFGVFLAIDLVWLGLIAKNLYQKYLGNFLSSQVNWLAAIIFYLLFVVGLSIFSIYPAAEKNSPFQAIISGALFGLFAYATYELTNLATLKDWPLEIVLIDMAWGAILSASVSIAGFYILSFFK